MLWLFDQPEVSGLFNLGTGRARTYLDLAHAVCDAANKPRAVEFIDTPPMLKGQYPVFHPGADGSASGGRLPRAIHPA